MTRQPGSRSRRIDRTPHVAAEARSRSVPAGDGMPRLLRAARLDHDAHAFLRFFNAVARRPLDAYPLADARRQWKLLAQLLGRRLALAGVRTLSIDGPAGAIELRVFRPEAGGGLLPGLLWIHGGGFIVGGLETSDSICRSIARRARAVVVAVRYRLAPEHDLHAGRDDCLAALRWLARHGASIGVDAARLAVGGDSAGGNIGAALAQACRAGRGPALRLQVLVYPATDLEVDFLSLRENASGYLLTAESIDWIRRTIATRLDLTDPWLSPARSADLRGLAPALIVTAGFDPIRDDALHYAACLRAAGVPVELLHYAGQFHGFLNCDALLDSARDALDRIALALGTAMQGQAADRTIEIADHPSPTLLPGREFSQRWTRASLMAWEAAAQLTWTRTLLDLALPRAAGRSAAVLDPLLAAGAWMPRALASLLYRRSARQTHPAASA
jgi:acetyl esterase